MLGRLQLSKLHRLKCCIVCLLALQACSKSSPSSEGGENQYLVEYQKHYASNYAAYLAARGLADELNQKYHLQIRPILPDVRAIIPVCAAQNRLSVDIAYRGPLEEWPDADERHLVFHVRCLSEDESGLKETQIWHSFIDAEIGIKKRVR